MAYNFVTVNLLITGLEGSTGQLGDIHFQVSDFVMDVTTGAIIVVDPIDLTANGGFTGNALQIPLLAMDDPSLSHNWSWLVSAEVPGMRDFPTRKLTVHFADGPEQNFVALAATSSIVT